MSCCSRFLCVLASLHEKETTTQKHTQIDELPGRGSKMCGTLHLSATTADIALGGSCLSGSPMRFSIFKYGKCSRGREAVVVHRVHTIFYRMFATENRQRERKHCQWELSNIIFTFFLTTDLSARWLTIQPSSFSAVVRSPFFGIYWKYTSV